MLFKKFTFDALREESLFAVTLFFVYELIGAIILMNFMATIISDAFEDVSKMLLCSL